MLEMQLYSSSQMYDFVFVIFLEFGTYILCLLTLKIRDIVVGGGGLLPTVGGLVRHE